MGDDLKCPRKTGRKLRGCPPSLLSGIFVVILTFVLKHIKIKPCLKDNGETFIADSPIGEDRRAIRRLRRVGRVTIRQRKGYNNKTPIEISSIYRRYILHEPENFSLYFRPRSHFQPAVVIHGILLLLCIHTGLSGHSYASPSKYTYW